MPQIPAGIGPVIEVSSDIASPSAIGATLFSVKSETTGFTPPSAVRIGDISGFTGDKRGFDLGILPTFHELAAFIHFIHGIDGLMLSFPVGVLRQPPAWCLHRCRRTCLPGGIAQLQRQQPGLLRNHGFLGSGMPHDGP